MNKQQAIRLLNWYNPTGKPWYDIPDDSYLDNNLAYDLIAANQQHDLVRLLIATPDWMQAKWGTESAQRSYQADLKAAIKLYSNPLSATDLLELVQLRVAQKCIDLKAQTHIPIQIWCGLAKATHAVGACTLANTLFEHALDSALQARHHPWVFEQLINTQLKIGSIAAAQATLQKLSVVGITGLEEAQGTIALSLAQTNRFDEARDFIDQLHNGYTYRFLRLKLAEALSNAGNEADANKIYDNVQYSINAMPIDDHSAQFNIREFARHGLALSLLESGRLYWAKQVTYAIEDRDERAEMLSKLAAAYALTGNETTADDLFADARTLINTFRSPPNIDSANAVLTYALAQAGRLTEVWPTLDTLPTDFCISVLRCLAELFTDNGQQAEAGQALQKVSEGGKSLSKPKKARHAPKFAGLLAHLHNFTGALSILFWANLYDHFHSLINWHPYFEELEPGLSLSIMCEMARIAGWQHPEWQVVHDLIYHYVPSQQ